MNRKDYKRLVWENLLLLIPFFIYGIYKNGILIYQKKLISSFLIFKNIYFLLIAVVIKIIFDLINKKKILLDYNLVCLVLVSMIIPYNTNLLLYLILLGGTYLLSNIFEKYFKFNKVCFIFMIIFLINGFITNFSYNNILEAKFTYSFSLFDILMGRGIGGISSTSIIFSFLAYIYLINTLYYKKNIPLVINMVYLFLAFIYYIVTKNNIIVNSEIIFSSIFIATLPMYSPYTDKGQIIYGLLIGILCFMLYIIFNNIAVIYLSILLISILVLNIKN